jgi:hypothetical protein
VISCDRDLRFQRRKSLDDERRWAGVNAVGVGDRGRCNNGRPSDDHIGACRKLSFAKLKRLAMERLLGFLSDHVKPSAGGCRDDGGKDAFDESCRHQPGLGGWLGQKLESKFGAQQRRTEIHNHDDTLAVIGSGNGLGYARSIGAEAIIRSAGCDLDARAWPLQYPQSQTDRRASKVWAMGDNNNSHHLRL